jgi:hypothetical protein
MSARNMMGKVISAVEAGDGDGKKCSIMRGVLSNLFQVTTTRGGVSDS